MTTQPPTPSRAPLTFVLLAGAGIAAAGVGGYLAQSHRQAELPAVEASPARPAPVQAQAQPSPAESAAAASPAAPAAQAPQSVDPAPAQPVEAPAPVERASRRDARPAPAPSVPARAARTERAPAPVPHAPVAAPPATPVTRVPDPPPAAPAAAPEAPVVASAETPSPVTPESAAKPAPPAPKLETFVIPADAVMGLEIENSVSSETARLEDRIDARVTRDVRGDGNVVLIPAGSRVQGDVALVEHGGKFKERARLGIRFHTLVLADGQEVPITTEPLFREGDAVGQKAGTRIGASAAGGAIIGAIFGGQKGAAIGAAAGAGAGTAATAASKRSEARFRAGSVVTVRLTQPLSITLEL